MAVAITRTADPAGVNASAGVATYTAASIGTVSNDRLVVLCVGTEVASGTITSATINTGGGAVAMKPLAQATFGNNSARMFWLPVPDNATTADFIVTFGVTPTNVQNHITVYTVTGAYPTVSSGSYASTDMDATAPLFAIFDTATGTPAALTMRSDIPTNGGFIGCASCADDTTTVTWAGATEDLDEDAGDFRWTTATSITGANAAITCTALTNLEDGALSFAMFCPKTNAFGALKAKGGKAVASITNPFQPLSPITLAVGDLVITVIEELSAATTTGVTDNLGHTGTALNVTGSTLMKAFYYLVTTAGDATISAACTASANDAAISVTVYAGPFARSPLDQNPNALADATSPYVTNLSGTLSQASELIVGYFGQASANFFLSTPSPGNLDIQVVSGTTLASVGVTSTVVSATTSLTMSVAGSASTNTLCGIATFKQDLAPLQVSYYNDPLDRIYLKPNVVRLTDGAVEPLPVTTPVVDAFLAGWAPPFSTPPGSRRGLKAYLQSTTVFDPDIEFPISYGYYNPLSEPQRQKIGLKTQLQPYYYNPAYAPAAATDYFAFYAPLSEPTRRIGLKTHLQSTTTFDPKPEFPISYGYYNPLSEPTRRIGIKTALGVEANWYVHYTPTMDHISWWNNFSEPVRKYGLRVAAEPANFFVYNEPINYVSWWRDFSTPTLRVGIKTAVGVQANWFTYFPAPTDLGHIAWWTNFSEPVRRTGLKTYLQSTTTTDPQREFPISNTSWWSNFSEPVRKYGLRAASQQASWFTYFPPPTDLGYASWWSAFSEPVRRRGFRTEEQQAFTAPQIPTVTFGYYAPLSEPVRQKKGISYTLQQVTSAPYNPTITFGYYSWWSEPRRSRPGLGAHLQRENTRPFNPTVSFSYYSRLSEPQRLYKPRLNVALQSSLAWSGFTPAPVVVPNYFFNWLDQPKRFQRGLSVTLQQSFFWPPRIIVGQVVTGIINAFQLNSDTAEISIFVRNYSVPTHALVSIEEIVNGYNVAIPHYLTSIQEVAPDKGAMVSVSEPGQFNPLYPAIFQPNIFQNNVFQVTSRFATGPTRANVSIEEVEREDE